MNPARTSRTAVYFRISTATQTTECQKPEVMALLKARGLTADAVYEEQASAAKRRPVFDRMLRDAQAGRFSTLVIWALDRFGRSLAGNIRDFIALDKAGIRVISVREPWMDSVGPIRELLIAIFSWAAEQERTRLIERTKAGIIASRARGVVWGRPCPTLAPKDRQGFIIDLWDDEGRPDGFRGLAAQLGCRSATTAWKLLKARRDKEARFAEAKRVARDCCSHIDINVKS